MKTSEINTTARPVSPPIEGRKGGVSVTADMLSAVNEYQGLRPENMPGGRGLIGTLKQLHEGELLAAQTKPFSIIHANTPWQVLHSPPRTCQRGLAGFPLSPLQRSHNERIRLYAITFLPPGMFLCFLLYLLYNKMSSKEMRMANHSYSEN